MVLLFLVSLSQSMPFFFWHFSSFLVTKLSVIKCKIRFDGAFVYYSRRLLGRKSVIYNVPKKLLKFEKYGVDYGGLCIHILPILYRLSFSDYCSLCTNIYFCPHENLTSFAGKFNFHLILASYLPTIMVSPHVAVL